MKFHFRTLGCKMNFLDSARVSAALQTGGHTQTKDEEDADVIFVNSCTVTSRADRQSRQETSHAERLRKKVAVFGCGPKVDPEKWSTRFPKALIFQSDTDILAHFGILEDELDFPLHDRTRVPIAIQTGCDNTCTFCITRIARGKTQDFPLKSILRQVQRAEESGIQEVVLTGIQLASWGCGDSAKNPTGSKLPYLLNTILDQTKIQRIRMSSLGPQFIQDDFFEVFQNPRICDHLHLSIQSGSPEILRKMNRGHGVEEVYEIAKKAKQTRANVALTADMIVGFPGETKKDFGNSVQLARDIGLSKIHVFPFSPRSGTGAENFPDQISSGVKKERAKRLRDEGKRLRNTFISGQMGKKVEVLVEEKKTGYSKNYIRLKVPEGKMGETVVMKVNEQSVVS